jgi:hypothetical protein
MLCWRVQRHTRRTHPEGIALVWTMIFTGHVAASRCYPDRKTAVACGPYWTR